ncbi:ABC transporter permease subunit [Dongia sedimenti]|uniref:ABC transporter permease subunit n=1 Tax=Dongia sedimenti TaxID=3064282 RepID=A0ABU0YVA4_9PROT|nr:ABC transporter permease subunit [Rhodospirillaceae bacterium R-7]
MTLPRLGLFLAALIAAAIVADYATLLWGATAADLRDLTTDAYLRRVIGFTFLQATLSAVIALAAAIPASRALARQSDFPGRNLILQFCALPMVMPAVAAIFGIVAIYGRSGYLAELAGSFGSGWRPSIYGLTGILIAHVFFNLPLAIRLLLPAWSTVPAETWRLTAQLGMSSRQIFRLIELPLLRQYVPAALVFIFILCFLSFAVVLTLGGGPRATTLEVAIYQALRLDVDLARGGALALLQTVACLAMVAIAWITSRRLDFGRGTRLIGARFDGMTAGARMRDFATIALAMGFVSLPVAALVFDGLRGLLFAQQNLPNLLDACAVTLALGLPSGVIATSLGYPIAVASDRLRGSKPAVMLIGVAGLAGVIASPMAVGAGITLAFTGRVDLFAIAPVGVIAMNALLTLPFAVGVLRPAVARNHAQYDRLCAGLGIAGWDRFHVVDWPMLRPALGLALGLTSAASMGDLAAIALFGNQDLTNLTLLLYNQISAYRMDSASGTALVLLALCLATFALIERGIGGRRRSLALS